MPMRKAKTRNLLVLFHLLAAGLMAPLFLLVAFTGGSYLTDNKGETVETPLAVPADLVLDPDAATIEADVRAVLSANDLDTGFDYLRMRPGSITTRPTSRDFVVFSEEDGVWSATLNQPSVQYSLMELHKGHGPETFRIYLIIAAITLFLVVLGGLLVGFMSPAYRGKTIGSLALGAVVFIALAFLF